MLFMMDGEFNNTSTESLFDEQVAKDVAGTSQSEEPKAEGKGTKAKKKVKKQLRTVSRGRAYIQATYNNTIVTVTDAQGNVLAWSSSGRMGFKGPKKSTSYAAGIVVRDVATRLEGVGLKEVEVFVKGVGAGREAAVRALNANNIEVLTIKDITPIPHNGPRQPKVRRV